jgi:predicted DNA-binding ArsR family transcriptional regulator
MSDYSRARAAWSQSEQQEIINQLYNGSDIEKIAQTQQRSYNAIQSKIYDIIYEMHLDNKSADKIAEELNQSKKYITDIIIKCKAEEQKKNVKLSAPQDKTTIELLLESNLRIEKLLELLILKSK